MNQVFLMGLRTLFVSTAVMLLVAPNQPAQRIPPSSVQRPLPPEAKEAHYHEHPPPNDIFVGVR